MKRFAVIVFALLLHTFATASDLPVRVLNSSDKTKPLLFYITGDGGWNDFSTSLVQHFNKQGFPVIGLDAKTYFQNRKTPEQAAQEVETLLLQYSNQWKENGLIFIGYSFGADVLPFIQMRLPQNIIQHVKTTLLLSPAARTDFEVHLFDILLSEKASFPVMREINQLAKPVIVFFGAGEEASYAKMLSEKIPVFTLEGGHHYNNNTLLLANRLLFEIAHVKQE